METISHFNGTLVLLASFGCGAGTSLGTPRIRACFQTLVALFLMSTAIVLFANPSFGECINLATALVGMMLGIVIDE